MIENEMPTIAELLAQPEGKTLDFKRDLSGKKGVLKDLVAFANTSGGVLVIGVDDDKTVPGIPDALAAEEKL
ncbi:MAG TPA: ATP-binding protein, partial [Gaiellaceae bacterium]|nr:ATP-binding protein [Gaiellaceae bacterium]